MLLVPKRVCSQKITFEDDSKRFAHNRKCGKNEEFISCGTECEPTCNVVSSKCTDKCLESVCQCKNGYKRGENGCQVPAADCK
ncbi:hypothetical protein V3C99_011562 [Haemonchus contortus]